MPFFFFHLHECDNVFLDPEGKEATDLGQAFEIAVRAARDVICGEVREGRLGLSRCIVIQDAEGSEVGRLPFKDAIVVGGC